MVGGSTRVTHRRWSRLALVVAATLVATFLAACTTPATEVLVIVDTDVPRRIAVMRTLTSRGTMRSPEPDVRSWTRTGAPNDFTFPASFGVVRGSAPVEEPVTLQVELGLRSLAPGGPLIILRRTARFRFVARTSTVIRLFVPISCSAEIAPPLRCSDNSSPCTVSRYCEEQGRTCGEGGVCIDVDIVPQLDASFPTDATEACVRQCTNRECGTDGCGGSCGTCEVGSTCSSTGRCVPLCVPDCAGRVCGPDGCGGSCGTCGASMPCDDVRGQCVCVPSCSGRMCGPDGCGGQCGACVGPATCNLSGQCVTTCTPDCTGRTCGPDSCGTGRCGECGTGSVCNESAGTCFACSPGAACSTGNPCTVGSQTCTATSAQCTPSPILDGTSCPGGACIGGTCQCQPVGCDYYGACPAGPNNTGTTGWQNDLCGGQMLCGACCTTGGFCNTGGTITEWSCGCGNPPSGAGWVDQGMDCWHRFSDPPVSC